MGDLNYDLLQDSHTFTDDFVDIMYDHSFYPIINKPTRITQSSSTCIDHIWTNIHDKNISGAIIIHKMADHLPVIQSTKIINIKTALPYAIFLNKIVPYLMKLSVILTHPIYYIIQVLIMQWIPLSNNILLCSIHISH